MPKARLPLSVGREDLHAVVAPVGHVHMVFFVHGDSPWRIQLALATAKAAEMSQVLSIQSKLLNAVVEAVGQEYGVFADS